MICISEPPDGSYTNKVILITGFFFYKLSKLRISFTVTYEPISDHLKTNISKPVDNLFLQFKNILASTCDYEKLDIIVGINQEASYFSVVEESAYANFDAKYGINRGNKRFVLLDNFLTLSAREI